MHAWSREERTWRTKLSRWRARTSGYRAEHRTAVETMAIPEGASGKRKQRHSDLNSLVMGNGQAYRSEHIDILGIVS